MLSSLLALCYVTATMAAVSKSTACPTLWALCVDPFFLVASRLAASRSLRNPRIRVVRVFPDLIRGALLPLPVRPG